MIYFISLVLLITFIIIPALTLLLANKRGFTPKISFKKTILILLIRAILVIIAGLALFNSSLLLTLLGIPFVVGTIVTSLSMSNVNNYRIKKSRIQGVSIEAVNALLGAILLFAGYSFFGIYGVRGSFSMEPTLDRGNIVITSKTYNTISRGSLIVYERPGMLSKDEEKILSQMTESQKSESLIRLQKPQINIKRVIGLPGETLSIKDNKINVCKDNSCFEFNEPYLSGKTLRDDCKKDLFILTDGYFVLGDNTEQSRDSLCCFGYECTGESPNFQVLPKQIKGVVVFSF